MALVEAVTQAWQSSVCLKFSPPLNWTIKLSGPPPPGGPVGGGQGAACSSVSGVGFADV